jgi:hypothetical protein
MGKGRPSKRELKVGVTPQVGVGRRRQETVVQGPDDGDHVPKFSFRYADRGHNGAWGWPGGDSAAEVLNFLCDMSQLTWNEIKNQRTGGKDRHKKHHHQAVDAVCAEAQRRFAELRLDEVFEEFFRFRLGGQKRLWGFVVASVYYVVWWDPDHQVCPSEKRHT